MKKVGYVYFEAIEGEDNFYHFWFDHRHPLKFCEGAMME